MPPHPGDHLSTVPESSSVMGHPTMPPRRRFLTMQSVALAMAISLATTPVTTWAAPGTPRLPEVEPYVQDMLSAYLRAFPQVSTEQALENLNGQEARLYLLESIGERQDAEFAGSWLDVTLGTFHLAVADPALVPIYIRLAANDAVAAEVTLVDFSLATLHSLAESINNGVDPVLGSLGRDQARVDVKSNTVLVRVSSERWPPVYSKNPMLHPAIQFDEGEPIVVEHDACSSRYSCGAPLRGGVVITRVASNAQCSLGFTASATDGSRWAITAGHCETQLNTLWRAGEQVIGPVRQSGDAGDVDIARIHINRSYWLQSGGGWLYDYYNPSSPANLTLAITYRTTISQNEMVCLNAMNSTPSQVCGFIDYEYGPRGMPQVGFDACPGDSGGAWFFRPPGSSSRWAYGVHSGGSGSCHAITGYSIFTSVPDMNAYFDGTAAARIRIEVHP